jgi:4a-hydroxytetrahydrobiopterin dehydratase
MKPSLAPGKRSHAKARNAALLNQLATPGLGSMVAGRWIEGLGQLILAITGFVLIMWWFVQVMHQLYGQINGDVVVQPVGKYLALGSTIFVVSWLWSLVTSLSLLREADAVKAESLRLFGASLVKMDEAKIDAALLSVPKWKRDGQVISRTYEFADFLVAMKFVNALAALAEQVQHHPDIDIRWNKVTLALTTHDSGGLTEKDFALARDGDALSLR